MRASISRRAQKDLDNLWARIAIESSDRVASNFIQRFYEVFITIASSPNAGIVAASLGANIRKFPLADYLIYYKPNRGGIQIIRIVHGKRKAKTRLFTC